MRYIELPAVAKRVSLRQYVAAIRTAKANPDLEFKHGLTCWWPCTGAQIMRQFREGCRERMARRVAAMYPRDLPRADRRRVLLDRKVQAHYLHMLRPELRPGANPVLCGDLYDSERQLVLWKARRIAQRELSRG